MGGAGVIGVWRTPDAFAAWMVGADVEARQLGAGIQRALLSGGGLDDVTDTLLLSLPARRHVPFSVLHVQDGDRARVVECDAPPLFLSRRGRLVLPAVSEDVVDSHLVRRCEIDLQDGDHVAVVNETFVCAGRATRCLRWRDTATYVRRWTETGCDAEQLLDALLKTYGRLAGEAASPQVAVIAMHVRPRVTATVWTGPPAEPDLDAEALELFMTEPGLRVLAGGTTSEIAAALLGRELIAERRPEDGWHEVPPTWQLEGVDLVTEGLITLRRAGQHLARASGVRDLPRTSDGAVRLARLLMQADVVRFLVGTAVNPQQVDAVEQGGTQPARVRAVAEIVENLRDRDRMVSVQYI
jgi:hypothetical protein